MKKLMPLLLMLVLPMFAPAGPSVTLAWDPSPEPLVKVYTVYFSTKAITNTLNVLGTVTVTNALTATVSNLNYRTLYYFRATAKLDGLESDFSNEASYTTKNLPAPAALGIAPEP